MSALWLADKPLVLASKSVARRAILEAAGIPVEVQVAGIDERMVEAQAGTKDPGGVALLLAQRKAETVAKDKPGRLVVGADQTLALGSKRFSKPVDRDGARAQLLELRGHAHTLHSGVALVRDAAVLYTCCETARLTMRNFSDSFLDAYLDAAGAAVTYSVGGYQLERLGVHCFERIEGTHDTILGLPVFGLFAALRAIGALAA
jgi:septum formation protein